MINFKLPLLALAVGAAGLLAGCQTASKTDSSTAAKPAETKSRAAADAEVVGTPAMNSKFTQLKMGMGVKQVTDLIGQPTDQGAYVTGKAWIPFYFGSDRYRHELLYKGQGRLIFAGGGVGDLSGGRLIRIMHNASESGYR